MKDEGGRKRSWMLVAMGGAIVVYVLVNLVPPLFIETSNVQFHVWNLELRGMPAVIVGLSFLVGGLLSLWAGLKGSGDQ